jgi:hypothetical protein
MTTDAEQEASWERRRKIASGSVDREEGDQDADGWTPVRHVFPERAEVAEEEAE